GISGIFQLVWASRSGITEGPLCTAQAAMLLFGDNGTAFWNVVISIHTFWTVVLGKRMSTVAVAFLIATGWTLCVILTVIGPLAIQTPAKGPFYSIAGAWRQLNLGPRRDAPEAPGDFLNVLRNIELQGF
ncbi:10664_t:CDS:2, partial [Acaulospora colombiana]